MGRLNVVVWGTGNVGRPAIRNVLNHPELELIGVVVSDEAKVGKDAGDLADADATGIAATHVSDAGDLLQDPPDAVVYASSADFRPQEAEDDFERILAAGANLVSCSIYPLYHPPSAPEPLRERMANAAAMGDSSLFVSGIDPGFGNDLLPIVLSGVVQDIEQIRCQEIFNYATYHAPEAVIDICGFGSSMEPNRLPPMVLPSVPTMVWGPVIRIIADALGVELDSIEEQVERVALEETIELPIGTFEAGTQGGLRFEIQGMVNGQPRIVVEHITRIHESVAPEWPTPPGGGIGCHRILMRGRPNVELTIASEDPGPDGKPDHNVGGIATAAGRIVNAIPAVVAAPTGLLTPLDLPLIVGRGLLHTGPEPAPTYSPPAARTQRHTTP
jgi:hypothetical protein